MPPYPALVLHLATSFTLITGVFGSPQVAFPVNSQVPPVAYVSQAFNYVFAPNTFTSPSSQISYSLRNQPAWLSLSGSARQLTGTPALGDLGAQTFEIVASDSNGQTSSNVTLVILKEQTISLGQDQLLSQLSSAGKVSTPATLLFQPQQTFDFFLASSLFSGVSANTVYYAVSSDRSPLPSWIQFDAKTLRFSGTTPPLAAQNPSQQAFTFNFGASNVVGFLEASIEFGISISDRLLAFTQSSFNFTTSQGSFLQIPSLLRQLTIDGSISNRNQITLLNSSAPSWLQLNNDDLSLSGTVPTNAQSFIFSVLVNGIGTNMANSTISIQVDAKPDRNLTDLGTFSVSSGTYFEHIITPPAGFDTNTHVSVNTGYLPGWLSFTISNNTLQGFIPGNIDSQALTIPFTFNSGFRSTVANLTVLIQQPTQTQTGPNPTATKTSVPNTSTSNSRLVTLVLAIVIPVLVVLCLVCVVLAWKRKRKRSAKGNAKVTGMDNSTQLMVQQKRNENTIVHTEPEVMLPYESAPPAENVMPQVELPWTSDSSKKSQNRWSKRPKLSHGSVIGSSWEDLIAYKAQSRDSLPPTRFSFFKGRKESDTLPTARLSVQPIPPQRPRRPDSPTSPQQSQSFQIPRSVSPSAGQVMGAPERLSAAGHGAGGSQSFPQKDPRLSWQTTFGTLPNNETRPSIVVMNAFPTPPSHGSLNAYGIRQAEFPQHGQKGKQSIRPRKHGKDDWHVYEDPATASTLPNTITSSAQPATVAELSARPLPDTAISGDRVSNTYETPPLPQRSQARQRIDQTRSSEYGHYDVSPQQSRTQRTISLASSRQFDSAISSDSQWEDEHPDSDANTVEERSWQTVAELSTNKVSPRLPSEPHREHYFASGHQAGSASQQARVPHHRKLTESGSPDIGGSGRSRKGSFRFI